MSEVYGRDVVVEAAGLNVVDLTATAAARCVSEGSDEKGQRAGLDLNDKDEPGQAERGAGVGTARSLVGDEEKGDSAIERGTEEEQEDEGEEGRPRMSKARIVWLAVTMLLTFFMSVSLYREMSDAGVDTEEGGEPGASGRAAVCARGYG
jgi:hypothetical protein